MVFMGIVIYNIFKIYSVDGYADRQKEPGIQTSAHSTQFLKDYLKYVIPEKQVLFSISGTLKRFTYHQNCCDGK